MYGLLEHVLYELNARQLAGYALAGSLAFGQPAVADAAVHHKHHHQHSHAYSEEQIIRAIAGEAGGDGYEAMLAVAGAIRNRQAGGEYKHDILRGIEGLHASHLAHDPKSVFIRAKQAWDESRVNNIVPGATIFGYGPDLAKWKAHPELMDMSKLQLVKEVGGNYFFKYR